MSWKGGRFKKDNQFLGMEAYIGVDAESVLTHGVECTKPKMADITVCLHGEEGDLAVLTLTKKPAGRELTEEQKAFSRVLSVMRVFVEYLFCVVKYPFGFVKVGYCGFKKSAEGGAVCAG